MSQMIKVGLIGFGYWGPNVARVFQQTPLCELRACCDVDRQKLQIVSRQYPHVRTFNNATDLLDSDVDAVAIATNISTHYELAREALLKRKHVLVEKPLTDNSAKALELVALAKQADRTLMAAHTFIYSPPVIKVKNLIDCGVLGDLHYISFSRVNLGLYQKDVDVIWDLAVHDVSILLYWLGEVPVQAFSFGRSCVQRSKYDVAFLWYRFRNGIIASCEVSWLSPQKMRRTCLVGSERMVVYDDTEPSEKIKLYDRGVTLHPPGTFGEFQLSYRTGDMVAPSLDNSEPLLTEVEHFLHCIENGESPRTDGQFGADVVWAIEMAANCKQDLSEESLLVHEGRER
jgi:predicted dehydrogenase